MARISPFILRFLILSLLLPAVLGLVAWLYYDDVRAKSYYYRLNSKEMIGHLEGAQIRWAKDSLILDWSFRDTVVSAYPFSAKKFNKLHYDFRRADGSELSLQVSYDSLPDPVRQVVRKVQELRLSEMSSPSPGIMQFSLAPEQWLIYHSDPEQAPPGRAGARTLDEHWYVQKGGL